MGRVRAAPLLGWGRWAPLWLEDQGPPSDGLFARPWGKLIC
jgi:hypothetical protein